MGISFKLSYKNVALKETVKSPRLIYFNYVYSDTRRVIKKVLKFYNINGHLSLLGRRLEKGDRRSDAARPKRNI